MVSQGGQPVEEPLVYRSRLVSDALRCQAWLILLSVVVGLLLGYGASVLRPGSYVATATVLISPLAGNPYAPGVTGQDSLVSIVTESKVASSNSVSVNAAKALGSGADPTALAKNVSVSVPPNTQTIQIAFTAKDPAFAKAAAGAYAEAYLESRVQAANDVNAAQVDGLNTQMANARKNLDKAKAALVTNPSTANKASVSGLGHQIVLLQAQIDALAAAKTDAGHLISPASKVQTSGVSRNLYLLAGGIFGLGIGIALAVARQRRDDRIYHADEIDLAGIPVVAAYDGDSAAAAEAVRLVRGRALDLAGSRSVVVAGPPAPGEPVSPVAGRLAQSLARLGRTVVLVDLAADPADTKGEPAYGLTDVLVGDRSSVKSLLLVEPDSHLSVLPRGRAELADAVEFLDSERLQSLLGELPGDVDYVVLQAPALTDSAGEALIRSADLTVVTVALSQSTRSDLFLLKSRAGDRIAACLIPRVKRRGRLAPWRSRKEGSGQVAPAGGEALTLVDGQEKTA